MVIQHLLALVLIVLLLVIALSALQARRSAAIQEKMEKAFLRLSFILPLTSTERAWWIFVSRTAGITEEILYRGFLIHYFFAAPFHMGLAVAVIASSVIFGAPIFTRALRELFPLRSWDASLVQSSSRLALC